WACSQVRSLAKAWLTSSSASRRAVSEPASVRRAAAWLIRAPARRSPTLVGSGPVAIGPFTTAGGTRLRHPLGLVVLDQGLDAPIETTRQQAGEIVHREPDAVVGHPVVRKVVSPDLLGSLAASHL